MSRSKPPVQYQPPIRCCGKNSYRSKAEAESVAEEQMLLRPFLKLAVYACTCGCHGWHLTREKKLY